MVGRGWGYLCFVLDVAKGLVPVMLAGALLRPEGGIPTLLHQAAWLSVAFGVIAGHVFSFWLRFRGGKGVATALGVVIGIYPFFTWAGLAALGVWIVVTVTCRYVSVGSIVAALMFVPLFVAFNWGKVGEREYHTMMKIKRPRYIDYERDLEDKEQEAFDQMKRKKLDKQYFIWRYLCRSCVIELPQQLEMWRKKHAEESLE